MNYTLKILVFEIVFVLKSFCVGNVLCCDKTKFVWKNLKSQKNGLETKPTESTIALFLKRFQIYD
jgi:hypothetical protein